MVSAIVFLLCSRASRVGFLGALCCREHGHECKLSARGRQRSFKLFFKLQEEGGGSEVLAFNFYYTNCPAKLQCPRAPCPIQTMVHTWWWLTNDHGRVQRLSATAVLLPSNVFLSFLIHYCCIFLHLWTDRFYTWLSHDTATLSAGGVDLETAEHFSSHWLTKFYPHTPFSSRWQHSMENENINFMASFDSQCFVGQM